MDMMILDWIQQNIVCDWLTPVMKCITFFGEYGLGWILIAVALLIPKKTRWIGLSMGVALLLGLLIGEYGLKNIIQRLRPFNVQEMALLIPAPHGFSCPSGHTTSSFAAGHLPSTTSYCSLRTGLISSRLPSASGIPESISSHI